MDKLPSGWIRRRSGVIVPGGRRRVRRAHAAAGIVIALVAFASPIASTVSALSRAGLDVMTLVRTVIDDDSWADRGPPACDSPSD